ncbi:DUF2953 domain-containing protein [Thermotalea metallivorans]|uniref:DUF2953 domain-containing protein n=1 Tax=Thermotalea metallivorans TaxID=520762 RepID=A0A140KZR3_9FIRM|nr:DUF2953 domain-containing protein [Thermotalea metallivorans]KXG73788.1 hypothetical protein AN619_28800 [Thermotalea metallivorans]
MIFWIVLRVLGIIFFTFLLALCCIPFEYTWTGYRYQDYEIRGEISWLFGGVKVSGIKKKHHPQSWVFHILGFPIFHHIHGLEKDRHKKKKDKKNRKEIKKKQKKSHPLASYFNQELFRALFKFARSLLKHMRPRRFECDGQLGFDDPCHTGMFWGMWSMLYPSLSRFDIHITPVFDDQKLEGRFHLQGRMIIGVFLFLAIKLLRSASVRNMMKNMINHKKEEKAYVI